MLLFLNMHPIQESQETSHAYPCHSLSETHIDVCGANSNMGTCKRLPLLLGNCFQNKTQIMGGRGAPALPNIELRLLLSSTFNFIVLPPFFSFFLFYLYPLDFSG